MVNLERTLYLVCHIKTRQNMVSSYMYLMPQKGPKKRQLLLKIKTNNLTPALVFHFVPRIIVTFLQYIRHE